MTYVDVFVASMRPEQREAYIKHCKIAAEVLKEGGALRVVECWGDDVPQGQLTDFYMAVQAEPGEVVVTGWIEWPSKEARDAGMGKMMTDPRMQPDLNPMPFNGRKMIYGGFQLVLENGA